MNRPIRDRLHAIRDRYENSQPGDWYVIGSPWGDGSWVNAGNADPHGGTFVCDCEPVTDDYHKCRPVQNAEFIAHAKADVRYLLKLVDMLAGKLREAREEKKGAQGAVTDTTVVVAPGGRSEKDRDPELGAQ